MCLVTKRHYKQRSIKIFQNKKNFFFYNFFQKDILRKVDLIHVTSKDELRDVRDLGLNQPVAIIPNGIDIPEIKYKKDRKILN